MYQGLVIVEMYERILPWLAAINAIAAVIFLAWPKGFMKVNSVMAKWISTDGIEEALNKERNIDSKIIKIRKILGIASAISAVLLIILCFRM